NTTYIASYFAPNGGYAVDSAYFASGGVDAPPLHALASGGSGGNGVFVYGPLGGFPTQSYNATNYWVAVVFSPGTLPTPTPVPPTPTPTSIATATPRSCPCRLWSSTTVPAVASANDSKPVELEVKFQADTSGYLTGLRFYKGAANTGTHVGH